MILEFRCWYSFSSLHIGFAANVLSIDLEPQNCDNCQCNKISAVTFRPEEIQTRNFGFSGSTQLSLCLYVYAIVMVGRDSRSMESRVQNPTKQCECYGMAIKSPDLSPIGQVWDLLDRHVRRPVQPQTLHQLQQALVQEWNKIPINVIWQYLCSMS